MRTEMRGQVARKDKLGPDVVRPQIGVRPARFIITSELRGYESANSSPPVNRRSNLALTHFWCSSDYSAPISLA
jgi:hypothetical protein